MANLEAVNALARYLAELRRTRALGSVPETSYYPALAELLNTVGLGVTPKVRCVVHPKSHGAGIPDLALFSADQIPAGGEPRPGVLPSRGVVEAKGTGADLDAVAASAQVAKYLALYGQVLVTNLREFLLLTRGEDGAAVRRERFALAPSEAAFWAATDDGAHDAFLEFLRRVLVTSARLAEPRDVAWLLASYARDARARVESRDLEALTQLRGALAEALGITFTGERGDHFFRSTLVQTLFYGVFSAWVLWHQRGGRGRFDWRTSAFELHVPMIRALFEEVAKPSRLEPLGLVEILDWAGDALNRVEAEAFFARFAVENAVQYFYEPFLEAFDPELRRELGVWYTPREIVRYQVARVDQALREELGVPDGLADPGVVVLDPCCGTGAYLAEVVRLIHTRLTAGGADLLALEEVKQAAVGRLFGFEILPAPFVVAHLQMGLMLQQMGVALSGAERARVYLTNALTGWEGEPPQKALPLPELAAERDAARGVKRGQNILVVLGNPPYNGFAGTAVDEERGLSLAYRTTERAPRPQGQGLNDLYVRFFRMAERCIVESTGKGVVCFISNSSWLDGLSFTGMRERYLDVFDSVWLDNCHGDKYRTGKLTPEGLPDPSVFSTPYNREGIQVGTAVATLVRRSPHGAGASVHYREFWGKGKLADIDAARAEGGGPPYVSVHPPLPLGLPFTPAAVEADYLQWPKLPELFPTSFPGVKTSRDDVVVDIDQDRLEARMRAYFDPSISNEQMHKIAPGAMESAARFDAPAVRVQLIKRGLLPENFVRYCYRPFDLRWLYWEPETKLLDEKRTEYVSHVIPGNYVMVTQQKPRREWSLPQVIQSIGSLDLMDRGANCIPLKLKAASEGGLYAETVTPDNSDGMNWNLSPQARDYLDGLGADPDALFFHALAVLHSPAYRAENAGALRQDWPRLPLPAARDTLDASAALGRQVAALLDPETPVPGVTTGPLRPELAVLASLTRDGGGGLAAGDLAVTAGWGNATRTGVMPGKGKVVARPAPPDAPAAFGGQTLDISLNAAVAWRNVPAAVWGYALGGYPVLKKWLSYREKGVLGRDLTPAEAREFQHTARRLAALLLLGPALDAHYAAVKAAAVTT